MQKPNVLVTYSISVVILFLSESETHVDEFMSLKTRGTVLFGVINKKEVEHYGPVSSEDDQGTNLSGRKLSL